MDASPLATALAKHFRGLYFGGNATGVCFNDAVAGVNVELANAQVQSLNTIATLVFHMDYYTGGILTVLNGGELTIRDKYSFDAPAITSETAWQEELQRVRNQATAFADRVAKLSDTELWAGFVKPQYGSVYDNITGNIEHQHYHLGQLSLLKKML